MKLLCPACERLAEPSGYRLDAGALLLRCSRCGTENVSGIPEASPPESAPVVPLRPPPPAPAAPPVSKEDLLEVPPGHCPKCIAPRQPEALSCAQCGLIFPNFIPEEHQPSAALLASFDRLRERWGEEASHNLFLRECAARGELAAAGRLYRIRLAHNPGDVQARRGRDEVVRLAMSATVLVPAERSPAVPSRWKVGVGVLLAGLALVAVVAFLGMLARMMG